MKSTLLLLLGIFPVTTYCFTCQKQFEKPAGELSDKENLATGARNLSPGHYTDKAGSVRHITIARDGKIYTSDSIPVQYCITERIAVPSHLQTLCNEQTSMQHTGRKCLAHSDGWEDCW